jgi:excisionase family DNA binding protein
MLTLSEVSQLLEVPHSTLRRWTDRGVIRGYRVGPRRDRKFTAEDVAIFLLEEGKGFQLNPLSFGPNGAGPAGHAMETSGACNRSG